MPRLVMISGEMAQPSAPKPKIPSKRLRCKNCDGKGCVGRCRF